MYPTIVGDEPVGHREHPGVSAFGEHVGTDAGQRPVRGDQPVVHAVHPARDRADAGQVQLRDRGTGQHPRLRARGDQRAHRHGVQLDVGVQVDTGEGAARLVAEPDRVRLARHRRLEDPHGHLPGRLGRAVGTRVGDHDDVELAPGGAGPQPAQVSSDDRFLVVRRDDDADHGLGCAHSFLPVRAGGQDSRPHPRGHR